MNWTQLLADLQKAGLTQTHIAQTVGCGQSSLSDLANGRTKEPLYRIGKKIVAMHEVHCKTQNPSVPD